MQGLIPAAGRGLRAHPKTGYIPKVLLEIDGVPIIVRNIGILRDSLGIRDITIITGYLSSMVRDALGDGAQLGVSLRYVHCEDPGIGLARGMLLAREYITDRFVTLLGDELYLGTNHAQLLDFADRDFDAVCCLLRTTERYLIRRNYSVTLENDLITSLVEKPLVLDNDILGCGTYLFTPKIFEAIAATPASPRSGHVELTDVINGMAARGRVAACFLVGSYFNVNTIADYNSANYHVRASDFNRHRISVIIPAFNEAESIGYVVHDFRDKVDEVFVVDNSSVDDTAEVARQAGARVETVHLIGYGDTIRYGLDNATGSILVVVEADHSFRARDLAKILEYIKDADMIVGTRTTREMAEQGTNMHGLVRWGNVIVAKMTEVLWWGQQPRFTDVGCTYRAIWKDAYLKIRPLLRGVGPELSPEMMVAVLRARLRVIEIPVSYHRRVAGESKHSASYVHVARTAVRMLTSIFRHRLGW